MNVHQHHVLTYALLGEKDEPWRNSYTRKADNCTVPEQLVSMGMMRLREEIHDYRYYCVTERGAKAVGLSLPDD